MFLSRVIINNLFCILLISMLLLVKRLFGNKVTHAFWYYSWLILLCAIGMLFFPTRWIQTQRFNYFIQEITTPHTEEVDDNLIAPDMTADWREDVSEILDASHTMLQMRLIIGIWVLGMIDGMLIIYLGSRKLQAIKRFSEMPSKQIQAIFERCHQEIGLKDQITLLQSELVASPMSFGWQKGYIVLPQKEIDVLSTLQLEHVLLHELMHFKHKDLKVNLLCLMCQLVYWFNPFIWWAFARMRLDQEAYCDWAVLKLCLGEEDRLAYGETLLHFATQKRQTYAYISNQFINHKDQLKYRILQIASYKSQNKKARLAGSFISILLVLGVIVQIPILAVLDARFGLDYEPDQTIKVVECADEAIFSGKQGSAVIYDLVSDTYEAYHASAITKRIAPCSTYKIYSAINAMQLGIITPSEHTMKWDHKQYALESWNKDQDLNSAIRDSVNWYFEVLDEKAGIKELSQFYLGIDYGNGYIGSDPTCYWSGKSLKISPLEQVELLKRLYQGELGFDEQNEEAVKQAMFISEQNGNKLFGKTGTGKSHDQEVCGWFIGYVEASNRHTYIFAVNLQGSEGANGKEAMAVTQTIFENMGITINTKKWRKGE